MGEWRRCWVGEEGSKALMGDELSGARGKKR